MIGLCADDHTIPMPTYVEPSMLGTLLCVVLHFRCNAYALRGPLLGANLASNLHETLVGKRER